MKKISNIIILAGGDSDRFWPLKEKFLFSFLGKSLLQRLVEEVSPYGKQIFVVCNKHNEGSIQEATKKKVKTIIQINQGTGMAAAVLSCANKVKDDVLILNASDFFDFYILNEFLKCIEEKNPDFICLAKKTKEYFPGAYIEFNGKSIARFVEKPPPDKVPSDILKLVVDYIADFQSFVKILKETETDADDQYEKGLNLFLKKKTKTEFVLDESYWYMLKYAFHLLSMPRFYLAGSKTSTIDQTATISKNSVINGVVHIGKRVVIGDYVKITGPCYIGDNTIIADYALVRESHIGRNCLIGSSSEVARSYLGNNVMLHRNYIGDSVLANNVLCGAGAVTANFRFDEKEVCSFIKENKINTGLKKLGAIVGTNTKIGVNSTIYPGMKIGSGVFIAPHEVIKQDIGENLFYMNGSGKEKK